MTAKKRAAVEVPEPVVVATRCSVCDLPWEGHGAEPSVMDCVRLLKARVPRPYVAPVIPWYPRFIDHMGSWQCGICGAWITNSNFATHYCAGRYVTTCGTSAGNINGSVVSNVVNGAIPVQSTATVST